MSFSEIKKFVEYKTDLVDTQVVCAMVLSLDWLDKNPSDEEFNSLCKIVRRIYLNDVDANISFGKIADVVACAYYGEYYFNEQLFTLKETYKGLNDNIYNRIYDNIYC